MGDRVLLIGSGGREHALARKLSQSKSVEHLFVAPGNAGTTEVEKTSNVALNVKDIQSVISWCVDNKITFVIVGPEDPLAAGIVDSFTEKGISCFGPTAAAAEIEASKEFSKQFMSRHNIPTARFESFTDSETACRYILSADFDALVVKASGLAAGKGVVVASTKEEACNAVKEIMDEKVFGKAGEVVIVEELLQGPEVSVLAFTDGSNVHLMPPAQDHKRLLDDDQGPNTGGMGAVCPFPGLSKEDLNLIQNQIVQKTVTCMAKENRKYVGVLYAGLMLTKDGPKVLEFNCRFGDPETQSILALLESDLLPTLKACVNGNLPQALPVFSQLLSAVGVVVVSGGYPGSYKKGIPISGLDDLKSKEISVIHAGTGKSDSVLVTSGGRVLAVVATDSSLTRAMDLATRGAAGVRFDGAFYRKDIGVKILKRTRTGARCRERDCNGLQYKDAGVDINAGDRLVQAIKPLAKMTRQSGCDAELGGFGGAFDLASVGLSDASLSCCTGGVGAKIKHALTSGYHFTVGYDLVANCANRLLSCGSQPLYFLDYFATGRLQVDVAREVVRGIAEACVKSGCSLVGGETAEMPGMYRDSDYDVAGMMVGVSPPVTNPLPRLQDVIAGDSVILLSSNEDGLNHSDFNLLDSILEQHDLNLYDLSGFRGQVSMADEVLTTTEILGPFCLPSLQNGDIKSFTSVDQSLHDTCSCLLPPGLALNLDCTKWSIMPVHGWMWLMLNVPAEEFIRHSGLNVSAIAVVGEKDVDKVLSSLSVTWQGKAVVAGQVVESSTYKVFIKQIEDALIASKNMALTNAPRNFELSRNPTFSFPKEGVSSEIEAILRSTEQPGVTISQHGLPAMIDVKMLNLPEPLLVSGTDGVGTKLKIAQALGQHSTIGVDLVAMCVNDVLASGAQPVFFTSYLATGRHQPEWQADVVRSIANGCRLAGCAFVDHQMSTIPSIYSHDTYDLAGFSVAAVDYSQVLPRIAEITVGDVLIGLPSSGIHSNGFSLVRRVIEKNYLRFDMPCPFGNRSGTLGEYLLAPTRIYVKSVLPAMHCGKVKSFAHITGGGLVENIPRALPSHLGVQMNALDWDVLPVFGWLQYLGNISNQEMARTFNCGLGAVLVVSSSDVPAVMSSLSEHEEQPKIVGKVVSAGDSEDKVRISNLYTALKASWCRPTKPVHKKKVAVLISGSGTNLQALIDYTQDRGKKSSAQIGLVISNKAGVFGLTRAKRAGIPTLIINHKDFKSRSEFDSAIHDALLQYKIDLVCLAGFMRILTGEFVNKWTGCMLNIHPSLLPAFKGAHAHRMVLEAKVRISGCSVHFVAEEVDAGAILVQESIPVYPGDTEATLADRVKSVEHGAFPRALEMVASGQVSLGANNCLVWNW